MSASKINRYDQLDSLRGLAALTVVIYHALNLTIERWSEIANPIWRLVMKSPIRVVWSGHQAVILFFVLSGFVLSLQFLKENHKVSYKNFLIKRICRIYIPYLLAVAIGFVMRISFSRVHYEGIWQGTIDWKVIVNHILMIGMFDQNAFDPVIWSLVQEMRISILFPIIMLLVNRYDYKRMLAIGAVLSLLGITLHYVFRNSGIDKVTNYYDTLLYSFMFIVGALIAKYLGSIIQFYDRLRPSGRIVLPFFGLFIYVYSGIFFGGVIARSLGDLICMVGSAILIISALCAARFAQMLKVKPLVFFGKISYSIYLLHLIIFLTIINVFAGSIPTWAIWVLGLTCTILLSKLFYDYVEVPCIKLGNTIVKNGVSAKIPERKAPNLEVTK
jgi:peptidoglycan/LPS O-acetylase OafA/YrhL